MDSNKEHSLEENFHQGVNEARLGSETSEPQDAISKALEEYKANYAKYFSKPINPDDWHEVNLSQPPYQYKPPGKFARIEVVTSKVERVY